MPDAPDIDFGQSAPDIEFGGGEGRPAPAPPSSEQPGRLESMGYGLSASIPFVDRATAAAEAAFGSGGYSQNLERIRGEHAAAYKAHPWLYTGSELAGGVAAFSLFPEGKVAETALAGAGRGALTGAGIGAVYGASESKDLTKPKETAASVGSGALGGALVGAPLGAAAGYLSGKASTAAKILAPDIVGQGKEAAATIREETGTASRRTAQTATELERHDQANRSLQADATPRDATATDGTRFTASTKTLLDYVEGAGPAPTDAAQKAHADALKPLAEDRKRRIEALGKEDFEAREHYYPHLLEGEGRDPLHAGAPGTGAAPGLGSTGFLHTRRYATISQAVAAGEKFKSFDVNAVFYQRMAQEDRYIALESVLNKGRENDYIKKFENASAASAQGYAALKARGPYPSNEYAPQDWARVYNAFASKLPSGYGGKALAGFRQASAFTTAFELGMSGYHAGVMTQEAVISDVARAAMQAATPGQRAGSAATFLKSPGAPIMRTRLGSQGAKIYSGIDVTASQETRRIVDLLTRAGARMATGGRQRSIDVETSRAGSLAHANIRAFAAALERGESRAGASIAQAKSIGAGAARIPGNVAQAYRATEGKPLAIAKTTMRGVGRILATTTAPLFDEYIPRLKNGAMMTQMADWIAANRGATEEATLAQARKIVNSIDNRFGEMVQDNIFWHQTYKHGLMGAMVSYSWNLGTARELGGGLADIGMILRGKKSLSLAAGDETSYKAAYTIALPIVWGMFAGAYQYLHGQGPLLTLQDYFAPRTGGTSQVSLAPDGKQKETVPERLSTVGYMKELHGLYNDVWLQSSPWKYGYGKTSAFIQTSMDLLSNRDWRGKPIADPNAPISVEVMQQLAHVLRNLEPITLKSILEKKPGSAMGTTESLLGFRPAAQDLLDPEAAAGWRTEEYKRGLPADERKAYGKQGPWAPDIEFGR